MSILKGIWGSFLCFFFNSAQMSVLQNETCPSKDCMEIRGVTLFVVPRKTGTMQMASIGGNGGQGMACPPHRMVLNNKKELVIHEPTRVGGCQVHLAQ